MSRQVDQHRTLCEIKPAWPAPQTHAVVVIRRQNQQQPRFPTVRAAHKPAPN